MHPPTYSLELSLSRDGREIITTLVHTPEASKETQSSQSYPYSIEPNPRYFAFWLINFLKPLFYHPQFSEIKITTTDNTPVYLQNTFRPAVELILMMLKKTQETIIEYAPLLKNTTHHKNHLFYNVDDFHLLQDIHQEIIRREQINAVYYENSFSGWNKSKRLWEKASAFTLKEFSDYIIKNQIRHIYTVNMYYQNHLMETEQLFLLPFLKAFGIELITFDFDNYETMGFGFIQKSALNCPEFKRFSLWPHFNYPLDQIYGNKNIHYIISGDIKSRQNTLCDLNNNFDVVVVSHARFQETLNRLPEALFFLEQTNPQEPYLDFQKLYYALMHLVLFDKKTHQFEKENRVRSLSDLYNHVMSFLKYDVVQSLLDNNIKTSVYGDHYWGYLFPEAYQEKYLTESEMEGLFKSSNHLYLLMNQNYSYFENNPVVLRAINLKVPYLCFSSVVREQGLEGMSLLEYRNSHELLEKSKNINQLIHDRRYQESLDYLCYQTLECRNNLYSILLGQQNQDLFKSLWKESESLLLRELGLYFRKNEERVFKAYDGLMSGDAKHYHPENSRFSKSNFLKKILQYYSKKSSRALPC